MKKHWIKCVFYVNTCVYVVHTVCMFVCIYAVLLYCIIKYSYFFPVWGLLFLLFQQNVPYFVDSLCFGGVWRKNRVLEGFYYLLNFNIKNFRFICSVLF